MGGQICNRLFGTMREPQPIPLTKAKARFSELVRRASDGEEIVISKAGKPVAKLVPLAPALIPRKPGGWEGKVWIAEDFDAPLPQNLQASFEGGTTEAMNRALGAIGDQQDPWVTATSRHVLAKVEWENEP